MAQQMTNQSHIQKSKIGLIHDQISKCQILFDP